MGVNAKCPWAEPKPRIGRGSLSLQKDGQVRMLPRCAFLLHRIDLPPWFSWLRNDLAPFCENEPQPHNFTHMSDRGFTLPGLGNFASSPRSMSYCSWQCFPRHLQTPGYWECLILCLLSPFCTMLVWTENLTSLSIFPNTSTHPNHLWVP